MTSYVGLWVDWGEDLSWGDANANCTPLLISATYTRGSAPEITGAAQAGSATFVLQNPAGLFDPDNAAGPLYGKLHDGVPVWFGMNEDGTITTPGTVRGRFAGRIVEIAPLPVAGAGDSTPTAEIICEDALGWYGRTPVVLTDECSGPAPGFVQGAFDSIEVTHVCNPTFRNVTTPGNLLLLFIAVAESVVYDSSLPPTFTNLHGGGAWTQHAYVDIDPNIIPSPAIGPPGAGGFGIYSRRVAVGEVTTRPVQVNSGRSSSLAGVWMWEISGVGNPVTVSSTNLGGPTTGLGVGETLTIGSAMSGRIVGGGLVGLETYGSRPIFTSFVGSTLQLTDQHNDPGVYSCPTVGWPAPFTWLGQAADGSTPLAFKWTQPCDPAYNRECAGGAAVVVPGLTFDLPNIPYPANQT